MKNTEKALKWIVGILESKNVIFQVSGGFAANLYGSKRELADIDIDIENNSFDKILDEVRLFIIFGPNQYIDENWNLKLLTLSYEGQEIDICGETKIFNKIYGCWVELKTDFSNSNYLPIYGITIPVIQKAAIVEYKNKLQREVDLEDIKALS
ncbi:MazG-related protein [Patescibacteria group bacterium]|nr:MazG-related protein [Patescibacteria group bacterium]